MDTGFMLFLYLYYYNEHKTIGSLAMPQQPYRTAFIHGNESFYVEVTEVSDNDDNENIVDTAEKPVDINNDTTEK